MTLDPLAPEALYRTCDPASLGFRDTRELEPLDGILGQDRAVAALEFGVEMARDGYNMYALGSEGTGRHRIIAKFLGSRAEARPVPDDYCYVFNFEQPSRPRALALPAGRGKDLQRDMDGLLDEFRSTVPAAFESDEYRARRAAIDQDVRERRDAAFEALEQEAHKRRLAILRTPMGFAVAPVRNGETITPDEFKALDKAEQERIEHDMEEIQNALPELIAKIPQWEKERRQRIRELNREVIMRTVGEPLDALREKYADLPKTVAFLDAVRADIADHVDSLISLVQGKSESEPTTATPGLRPTPDPFSRYRVNVIIDHGAQSGAPIVFEDNPTLPNLVGRVEHVAEMGALITDFSLIKAGALHRANGGYLIVDVRKVLVQPMAWEALKRALRSGEIRIESLAQSLSLVSTVSLEPEPIPLDVKVVLVGDRLLYYLLAQFDPEFSDLFKTAVDFEDDIDWSDESVAAFSRLLATIIRNDGLRAFSAEAVARVIEHTARRAGDSEKLAIQTGPISDLLREADYWAGRARRRLVKAADVQAAIDAQEKRQGRLRERALEAIERGIIRIDTAGEAIGQVNGLSVLSLGHYTFGKPSRITATVRMGRGQVVDIEREVALGGPIHSKGVLILSSFLGARFAAKVPLSLAASIVFEQSYGGIDGDSASSAELYCLLSALAQVPIRQSLAVTGSVDQHGRVQAIGGVNEKIEGFFDVCRARGLDGSHGVLIPQANVKHLMLRADIVKAVAKGRFHIYPVATVDEGIEILTGMAAGAPDADGNFPDGTVNARALARLVEFAENLRKFAGRNADDRRNRD